MEKVFETEVGSSYLSDLLEALGHEDALAEVQAEMSVEEGGEEQDMIVQIWIRE